MNIQFSNNYSKKNIRFSILVPSYNRPQYLKQTIESILNLNFSNFELIISDDNSPAKNEIIKIVNSFKYDIPFSFFIQNLNLGSCDNKNFLVEKANGEYLILIGDDDIINQDALNILENEISKSNSKASIYRFGYNIIDEDNNILGRYKSYKKLEITNQNKLINRIFFEGNILPFYFFHPFTICFKKSINISYKKVAHIGYDFLFLYESILNNHTIIVLPFIGFSWRKAQKIGSYQNLSNLKDNDLISRIGIYKYFFKDNNLVNKLNLYLPDNHICNFIGNTIVLDKNSLIKNLALLNDNLELEDYNQIHSYVNKKNVNILILKDKVLQCIKLQGIYSIFYFLNRIYDSITSNYINLRSK